MPNARLDTHRLHPNLVDLRRKLTISMCYIKTEVRHAIDIERSFALITPLEVQFARQFSLKVPQLEAAPALIVQAPPGAAPLGPSIAAGRAPPTISCAGHLIRSPPRQSLVPVSRFAVAIARLSRRPDWAQAGASDESAFNLRAQSNPRTRWAIFCTRYGRGISHTRGPCPSTSLGIQNNGQ